MSRQLVALTLIGIAAACTTACSGTADQPASESQSSAYSRKQVHLDTVLTYTCALTANTGAQLAAKIVRTMEWRIDISVPSVQTTSVVFDDPNQVIGVLAHAFPARGAVDESLLESDVLGAPLDHASFPPGTRTNLNLSSETGAQTPVRWDGDPWASNGTAAAAGAHAIARWDASTQTVHVTYVHDGANHRSTSVVVAGRCTQGQ
jgi:hypothetical protein